MVTVASEGVVALCLTDGYDTTFFKGGQEMTT